MLSGNVWKGLLAVSVMLLAGVLLGVLRDSLPGTFSFLHEDGNYPVSIQPKKGFFIFDIPPPPGQEFTTVTESSRVAVRIDGKPAGAFVLSDANPHLDLHLTPGPHRFDFTADIDANDSVIYDGSCTTTLEVRNQPMNLRPWFDFSMEPGSPLKGHLSVCQLIE